MLNKQKIEKNNIEEVFSFGCSVSDYMYGAEQVYGEFLSEKLNSKYHHHGIGGGSNHRIWRKFFKNAQLGNFNYKTLVTIQWTDLHRTEFFSRFLNQKDFPVFIGESDEIYNKNKPPYGATLASNHLDGFVVNYKWDAWEWYPSPVREYMKMHTDNMISDKWSYELWKIYEFTVFEYCKNNNIPLIVLNGRSYNNFNIYNQEDVYFNIVDYQDLLYSHSRIDENDEKDISHMSKEGHKILSDRIYNILN
jgi:hypothetical protein